MHKCSHTNAVLVEVAGLPMVAVRMRACLFQGTRKGRCEADAERYAAVGLHFMRPQQCRPCEIGNSGL